MTMKEAVLEIIGEEPLMQDDIKIALNCQYEIKTTTRQIRSILKDINQDFINGNTDFMVVSNKNGCRISKDEEDIRKFNEARKHQALSLLYGVYNSNKRIGLNKNLSFEDFIKEK